LVGLVSVATFSAALTLQAQTADSHCVRQSALALGRVRLAAYVSDIHDNLGAPLREHHSSSEDDGGRYEVLQLQYEALDVDIGRGHRIERLVTTSPAVALPSGVHVGMTLGETARRLHLRDASERLHGDTLAPTVCSGDDVGPEARILLIFPATSGGEPRLAKIELTNHGP
jgi:hypothetical protein